MAEETQRQFNIQRTYLKDLSFETPMGVEAFTQQAKPNVKVDLNTKSQALQDGIFEVVLRITITTTIEEKTAYLIEVQQAGIFYIQGFEEDQVKHILGAVCPNFLFPYAREIIDSTAVKGSFGPLNLSPVDFDAIFRQSQQQAAGTVN
ncbi:protein-export chaperone SecB [bacterium]|nr:protein-export chaperone SecB [bacterium]